jgi:hypothetical protein
MTPARRSLQFLVISLALFSAGELRAAARSAALPFRAGAAPAADGGATVSFRKVFKSSTPEFTEIRIRESGPCSYDLRSLDDPPDPQPFDVGPSLRAKIFALAAQLQNFRGVDLDIKRRIANLGEKNFRYERGSEVHEVRFNYTLNATANQLLQIFEGLTRQQELLITLTRRMKYDRLGVNDALLQLDSEFRRQLLPEPEIFLPTLEQIGNDSRIVEIARQRARSLVESIRHPR